MEPGMEHGRRSPSVSLNSRVINKGHTVRHSSSTDPYGRPATWKVLLLLVAVGLPHLFGALVFGEVGNSPTAWTWPQFFLYLAGLLGWLLAIYLVVWIRPKAKAVGVVERRLVRPSRPRFLLFSTVVVAPAYILLPGKFLTGWPALLAVVAVAIVQFTLVFLPNQFDLWITPDHIERIGPLGGQKKVGWGDITRLRAIKSGVYIFHPGGYRLAITNWFLNGYPEFAKALLERVPRSVLDDPQAGRATLERQAALLGNPEEEPTTTAPLSGSAAAREDR
jgi:hypothetical protein